MRSSFFFVLCAVAMQGYAQDIGLMKKMVFSDENSFDKQHAKMELTNLLSDQVRFLSTASEEQFHEFAVEYGNNPIEDLIEVGPALTPQDFTEVSKQALENNLRAEISKNSVLTVALSGGASLEPILYQYGKVEIIEPPTGKFYGTVPWAVHMTLARRGEAESSKKLLKTARESDEFTQVVILLKELAFVTRPEVVAYMNSFLMSEKRLPPVCSSSEQGAFYAQYALSALSRMINDFPVPYRPGYGYSRDEIESARVWMRENENFSFRNQK